MKKLKYLSICLVLLSYIFLPFKVNAATVSFFTSGGGTFFTGSQVNLTVYANGSEAYNAVTVNVNFSNMTLLGVSAVGGWTPVSGPSAGGSSVSFSGALLGGSATGSREVLSLSFRLPFSPGSAFISSSGTIALADGQGTQVNGGGNQVGFNIISPPPPPPPPEPAPNVVTVSSESHPDQGLWYQVKNASFNWNLEEKVDAFSYEFNQIADTVPDDTPEGTQTSASFENLEDGVYYFHIKARNNVGWGETAHFKINIDSTPPDPFGIATLETEDGERLILFFYTNDSLSGVSYFNVTVDGEDLGKQESRFEIDKDSNIVIVTAFDNAGNSRSQEFVINEPVVDEEVVDESFSFDFVSSLITLALISLILGGVGGGYYLFRRYKRKTLKPTKIEPKKTEEDSVAKS